MRTPTTIVRGHRNLWKPCLRALWKLVRLGHFQIAVRDLFNRHIRAISALHLIPGGYSATGIHRRVSGVSDSTRVSFSGLRT